MTIARRYLAATVSAVALLFAAAPQAEAQPLRAEVLHWWTSGGESAGARVFAERYNAAGGQWVDTAIAGGANARTAGINRIVGGNPPTVMQFNTGKQFDELVEAGMISDLSAIATRDKWATFLPKGIAAAITRQGKVYAVPINIHGQHWLFYSTKVLADAGVEPPRTWNELIASADKLRAKGYIPLALGGQPNWERGLFNSVLVGHGGPELFQALWGKRDVQAVRSAAFLDVAETFKKLRALVDPGSPGRNWNDAAAMVIQGKAAYHVMGDWAKGEFIAAGQTAGKEYGCALLGDKQVLTLGGDVFVFPKTNDANARAAQEKMIQVMLDPVTQIAFNTKKGSIPVRTDIDVSQMDECARKGAAAIADPARQVESNELLSPPDLTGAMQDVITQYWNTPGMDAKAFVERVLAALRSAG